MRITRQQLTDLINEEISSALLESQNRRLLEVSDTGSGDLYDIDGASLLEFADAYVALGAAVQEQLRDLLDNQEDAYLNENAVQMIEDRLGGMNSSIDEALEAWKAANGDGDDEDDGTWAAAVRANR